MNFVRQSEYVFNFRNGKQPFGFSPSFCKRDFGAFRSFSLLKSQATRSVGEPILIMPVSKEAVAAGAWASRSPTSYAQILFLEILAFRTCREKRGKT